MASILVKWVPVVFLSLRAVEARASGRRVGHLGFALAAVGLAALATCRYGFDWLRAFGPLARNAEGQTSYALPHRLEQLGAPHGVTLALAALVLAAGLAWLAREAARGGPSRPPACLLLATTPWLAPWYTIWALPLAAVDEDRRAQLLALGLLRLPAAADDPALAPPEDEHAVLGEDARNPGRGSSAASGARARAGLRLSR